MKRKKMQFPGSLYYPLFEHMASNHGLILLESELDEICRVVMGILTADIREHLDQQAAGKSRAGKAGVE